MDLGRHLSAQGRVRPRAVVVGHPSADAGVDLRAGLEGIEVDALVFERAPEPLDEHIVEPARTASMEMRIPASASTSGKWGLLNWLPWTPFCLSSSDARRVDLALALHDEREDLNRTGFVGGSIA